MWLLIWEYKHPPKWLVNKKTNPNDFIFFKKQYFEETGFQPWDIVHVLVHPYYYSKYTIH